MDKIYRVQQGMGGRYVLERDGAFTWLEGDIFGAVGKGLTLEALRRYGPGR